MTGTADDRGEHGARRVIAGESSLHQAGAVVAHQGGSLVVVAHDVSSVRQDRGARNEVSQVTVSVDNSISPLFGSTDRRYRFLMTHT